MIKFIRIIWDAIMDLFKDEYGTWTKEELEKSKREARILKNNIRWF